MKYTPRASDIQWTRNLIDQMKDGGLWGIPRAKSIWRFDKTNKVLIQIHGSPDELDNRALRVICPLIGWTTAHKPETLTPAEFRQAMQPHVLAQETHGTGKMREQP